MSTTFNTELSAALASLDLITADNSLPDEVLCRIFNFLDATWLGSSSLVCMRWNKLVWGRLRHLEFDRKDLVTDGILGRLSTTCPELTALKISRCLGVRDNCARALLAMRHLKVLQVNYCDWITDAFLEDLRAHKTLTELSLVAACRITIASPLLSTQLKTLNLTACRSLDKIALTHIWSLPHLTCLDLSDSAATLGLAEGILSMPSPPGLVELSLRRTGINDDILQAIGEVTTLKRLDLSQNPDITSTGIAHLTTLVSLSSLDLTSCFGVSDAALISLGSFSNLQYLNLIFTGIVKDGLDALVPIPAIRSLKTTRGIASMTLLSGLSRSPDLTQLCLTDCSFDPLDVHLLGHLTSLHHLDLSTALGVGDSIFEYLARLTHLQTLNMSSICTITPSGVSRLRDLPRLAQLVLDWCLQIDDSIGSALIHFPTLTNLSLRSCKSLSDQALPDLLKLHKLEVLDLTYCVGINSRRELIGGATQGGSSARSMRVVA
jgi:hypothetical protein